MSSLNYPTLIDPDTSLTVLPNPIWREGAQYDPTDRTRMNSGVEWTALTKTFVPKVYEFEYRHLHNDLKEEIEAFEEDDAKYGANDFNWTNPLKSEKWEMKFADKVAYRYEGTDTNEWTVVVKLKRINTTIIGGDGTYGSGAYGSDNYGE